MTSANRRVMLLAVFASLATTAATRAAELTMAAMAAVTGPYAFTGVPTRDGLLVALDEINAKRGASDKIKLIVEDTAGEKQQAISLTNRFAVRDKALITLGPNASSEGVAVAPIANDLKVPLLSTTALADGVSKAGPWSFRTPASPAEMIGSIAQHAIGKNVKKVGLVFARDNEGQIGQKNVFKEALLRKKDIVIAAEESVLTPDTDFQALITKLTSLDVDALFVTLVAEQSANFIIQARQAGIDPSVQVFGPPNMGSVRFIDVGGKAVENTTFVSDYFFDAPTPGNKEFADTFRKRFNRQPDNYAALGYTALHLAVMAADKAGASPTREGIRDALAGLRNVPTILGSGTFSFDDERAAHYGAVLLTVKGGKFVVVQ